jgi:hypothetical protein
VGALKSPARLDSGDFRLRIGDYMTLGELSFILLNMILGGATYYYCGPVGVAFVLAGELLAAICYVIIRD